MPSGTITIMLFLSLPSISRIAADTITMPVLPSRRSWCVRQIFFSFLTSLPSLSFVLKGAFSHSLTHALLLAPAAGAPALAAGAPAGALAAGAAAGAFGAGAGVCADAGVAAIRATNPRAAHMAAAPRTLRPLSRRCATLFVMEYKPF